VAYHVRGGTAVIHNGINPLGFHHENSLKAGFLYLSDELKKRYIKNRYRCMIKNDSILGILANLPFILWYDIKIWCYFFLTRIIRCSIIQ